MAEAACRTARGWLSCSDAGQSVVLCVGPFCPPAADLRPANAPGGVLSWQLHAHAQPSAASTVHTWSPKVTTSNSPPAVRRARISHMGLDRACAQRATRCMFVCGMWGTCPQVAREPGVPARVLQHHSCMRCCVFSRHALMLILMLMLPRPGPNRPKAVVATAVPLLPPTFLSMAHTPTLILLATPCLQSGACTNASWSAPLFRAPWLPGSCCVGLAGQHPARCSLLLSYMCGSQWLADGFPKCPVAAAVPLPAWCCCSCCCHRIAAAWWQCAGCCLGGAKGLTERVRFMCRRLARP